MYLTEDSSSSLVAMVAPLLPKYILSQLEGFTGSVYRCTYVCDY